MQETDKRKVVIELQDVKRNFIVGDETVHALRGVSFKIYEGEFVTIMGTSGSGKSTLLNQLGCLDTPTSGEYILDGTPVRAMRRRQRAVLYAPCVAGNVPYCATGKSVLYSRTIICWPKRQP